MPKVKGTSVAAGFRVYILAAQYGLTHGQAETLKDGGEIECSENTAKNLFDDQVATAVFENQNHPAAVEIEED